MIQAKKTDLIRFTGASILSGLLLSVSWWQESTPLLLLFSLVPMFFILDRAEKHFNGRNSYILFLPAFLVYNLITISWLGKVSIAGALLVILENSALMAFTPWLALQIRNRTGRVTGYLAFIILWMTLEQISLNVKIVTPWLNLGNAFGSTPNLIQWYEYTGVSGGTLWVLVSNLAVYRLLSNLREKKNMVVFTSLTAFIIIVPVILSVILGKNYSPKGDPSRILIVQPNIDPFNEKFSGRSFEDQLNEMLAIASSNTGDVPEWIIFPETAVDDPFYESKAKSNKYALAINEFLTKTRGSDIVCGFSTMTTAYGDSARIAGMTRIGDSQVYYSLHNSAVHFSLTGEPEFYHKSELIPGIEEKVKGIPAMLSEKIIPELGGSMAGYSPQANREVFTHSVTGTRVAPVICYESAFGSFMSGYTEKGAEIIFIITNDGWWANTAGYRQHLSFASIRAIEQRRDIARAANNGISAFINQKGEITSATSWWSKEILAGNVLKNSSLTFYSKVGDILYKYAVILTLFLITIVFVAIPIRKLKFSR